MKRAAIACAVLLALPATATAATTRETSQAGGVSATLSYNCDRQGACKDFSLSITRNGVQAVSESIRPEREAGIAPGRAPNGKSVLVTDLNRDGEPEVLVDLYSGGAHCCFYSLVYGYSPGAQGYLRTTQHWGDVGYRLRDLGGDRVLEFYSADYRFAYAFSSFAESGFPIQVWRYREPGSKLGDVTRRFPRQVRRDARGQLRDAARSRREHLDVRGALAAYQADEYLLGRKQAARGWKRLRKMAHRGQIKRPRGAVGSSGTRYLRSLLRFLRRLGYTH